MQLIPRESEAQKQPPMAAVSLNSLIDILHMLTEGN